MPAIKLNLTIGIDEEHEEFIEQINEELDGQDAVDLIEGQLEENLGPNVEEIIYRARQQVKRNAAQQ